MLRLKDATLMRTNAAVIVALGEVDQIVHRVPVGAKHSRARGFEGSLTAGIHLSDYYIIVGDSFP